MTVNSRPPQSDAAEGLSTRRSSSLSIFGQAQPAQKKLWRGEGELLETAEAKQSARQEFPDGTDTLNDDVSRRSFVQLLGSSLALTATACYRPNQKIIPYVNRPPEVTPGNPLHFPTALQTHGYAFGVLVESHEGRPTKVEGNPLHPDSLGRAGAQHQAAVLDLYDPDRAQAARHEGRGASWRDLSGYIQGLVEAAGSTGGAGVRFLIEPSTSPLLAELRGRIQQRLPQAKFVSYSVLDSDNAVKGARLAFGRALEPRHDLSGAKVIFALDSDFLEDGPEKIRLSWQFAQNREPGDGMNRLYVAEPTMTVTGSMADHRLRLRGTDMIALAQAVLAELGKILGRDTLGPLADLPLARAGLNVDARWVSALAKDLARNRGRSVVIAGYRQPPVVHALVNAMNFALGNVGSTVAFAAPLVPDAATGIAGLRQLAEDIAAGQVNTLFITSWNPVYTAPVDFKFAKLLERVPNTIYLGAREDETARVCKTFVPQAHTFEGWGDLRALDGTVTLVQPLIAPLWPSVTQSEFLAAALGQGEVGSYQLLKDFWKAESSAKGLPAPLGFEAQWEHWLGKGIIEGTGVPAAPPVSLDGGALASALRPLVAAWPKETGLEVAYTISATIGDGRFANNAWLQELPHPITKITWDNAVLLAYATATRLSLKTEDIVELKVGERVVRGPVYIQPGQAEDAITVALGYGRAAAGSVGTDVGFNAYLLRESASPWFVVGAVSLTKVGSGYEFGITQEHWRMEGRDPAKVGTLAETKDEHSPLMRNIHHNKGALPQIHKPVDYSQQPYKWAMAIDLTKCTGCGACTAACQAENNIPVVGRANVRMGREMHWIRIDRYYETDESVGYNDSMFKGMEDPKVVTQPIACVHCETAPCEYVCPVNATVHSDEGLNEMVYNRCIGTRYCNNNCPYKARRFNYLDYHGEPPEVKKMVFNPDVTVRSRGVMEKCTYCVQRIERARIDARIEGKMIPEGGVITACQQTCPTGAIVFGSLNDPNSAVAKAHADERRYDLLHELNTRPRTAYLARVRNPNPELV